MVFSLFRKLEFNTKNKIRGEEAKISSENSKVLLYIVPTNEELVIAQDTYELTK